jgi:uncharacterized RDD family membrane protein YckC
MAAGAVPARGGARDGARDGAPVVGVPAVGGLGESPVYVGLVTRLIAIAVDALVIDAAAVTVAGAVLLVFSVFAVTGNDHPLAIVLGGVAFVVWVVSYFGSLWTTTGQTLGSRVMQIRVTTVDGGRMRPRHAVLRLVGMVISLPLFWGYVPVLWSPRRRGVPDLLSGTVVTQAPAHPELTADQDVVAGRRVIAMVGRRDFDRRATLSGDARLAPPDGPRSADSSGLS